jgi:prepilin-type processing-associated H-X9-DG protein
VFTFLDEHGDSIDDGVFQLDPGQNTTGGSVYFRNMPANYHDGAYSVSFADGHSQEVRLQQRSDTKTASSSLLPVVPSNAYLFMNNYNGSPKFSGGHYVLASSPDYNTLDNEEPYQ